MCDLKCQVSGLCMFVADQEFVSRQLSMVVDKRGRASPWAPIFIRKGSTVRYPAYSTCRRFGCRMWICPTRYGFWHATHIWTIEETYWRHLWRGIDVYYSAQINLFGSYQMLSLMGICQQTFLDALTSVLLTSRVNRFSWPWKNWRFLQEGHMSHVISFLTVQLVHVLQLPWNRHMFFVLLELPKT